MLGLLRKGEDRYMTYWDKDRLRERLADYEGWRISHIID